jgi:hypothetical protein
MMVRMFSVPLAAKMPATTSSESPGSSAMSAPVSRKMMMPSAH